jgi:hypothetical protein
MPESKNDLNTAPERPVTGPGAGFKFNPVGREEPASRVLVPQVDPAVRRRTRLIIGLAVIAIILLILLAANPFGVESAGGSGRGGGSFDPPPAGETRL